MRYNKLRERPRDALQFTSNRYGLSIALHILLLGLPLFLTACGGPKPEQSRTFLLRSDTQDVTQASEQLITEVMSQLEASHSLPPGYPLLGRVELQPDPSDPGVQIMRCAPTQLQSPTDTRCILINQHDDFIRAQAITWESAAFYMYRLYVAPKSLFARVNPAKDFVALDTFLLQEEALWEVVDAAIRAACAQTGARPFHP